MSRAAELAKFIGDGTLGLGGAEDKKLVFDGNAQDFHIGLDDSADSLTIGLGSALGTTSHMVFDANGHITKPLQPAFLVHPASNQDNISTGSTTVVFGTERFDQNGDFASNTFTAPVTGKYLLTYSLYLEDMPNDSTYIETFIDTSNTRDYYHSIDPRGFDTVPIIVSMSQAHLVDLDANDTVTVRITQAGGSTTLDINTASHFSGFLVC